MLYTIETKSILKRKLKKMKISAFVVAAALLFLLCESKSPQGQGGSTCGCDEEEGDFVSCSTYDSEVTLTRMDDHRDIILNRDCATGDEELVSWFVSTDKPDCSHDRIDCNKFDGDFPDSLRCTIHLGGTRHCNPSTVFLGFHLSCC